MKMGKRWCAVLLSLMLLLGCLPASAMYEGEKSGYGLTPVSGSVSSAEPDGTWIFTTPEAKTAEAVGASLSIEGQPPLLVEEHSETEFYVTPSEALSGNTLYRFCWQDENETLTWAFQTQKRFAVSAVFPAQAATGVPTSVSDIIQALVIVFSVAGMALTKLPDFEAWKSRVFGKRKEGAA